MYPVVAYWGWGSDGFLSTGSTSDDVSKPGRGLVDIAGCGIVHMTGGCAGIVGAWIIGPRTGRFSSDGKPLKMPGHSTILAALGTFLLWFGWYGFNCWSVGGPAFTLTMKAAVNTTMGASTGAISTLIFNTLQEGYAEVIPALNGAIGGLVSVTGGCHVMEPWGAFLAGLVVGPVVVYSSRLQLKLKIDDAIDAGPAHYW